MAAKKRAKRQSYAGPNVRAGREAHGIVTKLTPDAHATIVNAIKLGNYRETAAAEAGVDARTLRNWLKRGALGEEPFVTFRREVIEASARAESSDLMAIRMAGRGVEVKLADGDTLRVDGDWRALAWRLERMFPRRWGQQVRLVVDQELEAMMAKLKAGLTADEFDRVLEVLSDDADRASSTSAEDGSEDEG